MDTELGADSAPDESDRDPQGSEDSDRVSWQRYDYPIDLDNPLDSRAKVVSFVPSGPQRVLELGCSTGAMTQFLAGTGHQVTAVEIDPIAAHVAEEFAERVLVGDLDRVDADGRHLLSELGHAEFDTLIAADVLEHLRDPVGALRRALELVRPDGLVIMSIPNVAHGDVRLALLAGDFDYQNTGLLDRTHTHLFTLKSLVEMIRDVGLAPVGWNRVRLPLGSSEIEIDENLLEFGRRVLSDDDEAETYQWIVACQDPGVVEFKPDWPDLPPRASTVGHALDMMNSPTPHPGHQDAVAPVEIDRATTAGTYGRRLRRAAAWCRDRLAVRLVR